DALPTVTAQLGEAVFEVTHPLRASQRALYPFQATLGPFLDKIGTFVLDAKGLLYHLTGMVYKSMVAWIKKQVADLQHTLPTQLPDALQKLPLVKLGAEYFKHFKEYIENALERGELRSDELAALTERAFLPE